MRCSRAAAWHSRTCSTPSSNSSSRWCGRVASRPNRVRSLATLRLIADAQRASFEKKEQFGVVNASFHRTLVKLADSDTMVVLVDTLREVVARYLKLGACNDCGPFGALSTRRRSIAAQERLTDLLLVGDGNAAARCWRQYLSSSRRRIPRSVACDVVFP
jgi:DNA-binding GntR family transcriptional regulator